ncbi:hypothetical protein [Kordia sp.]
MNSMRALFLFVALITGIVCFIYDSSGMGFISGMSLLATGVTYIGKEE